MPAAEFNAWMAYYSIFPFGEARGDMRAGIIASTIANVNRGRGSRAYTPADFMPQFNKPRALPDQIIEQRISKFMLRYH